MALSEDEMVAALQGIFSPGHAGSTCSPAQASQMHATPVLVDLAELAEMAEMAEMVSDDDMVAALQDIFSPGHAGSTCSPAQASAHACGSIPAQAHQQQMQMAIPAPGITAMPAPPPFGAPAVPPAAPPVAPPPLPADLAQMFDEPIGPNTAPPDPPAAAPLVSIPLQQLSGFGADASQLHFLFTRLFTPKHPNTLPRSQWLSYTRLFSIVQPYAPARVWTQGRGNLKQLVIEWAQHHPAYAGLATSAWCVRLDDYDQPQPQPGQKRPTVSKFCLEYTP